MRDLEKFKAIPTFRFFIGRDFDRIGIEEGFLIEGFLFLFFGSILSSLKILFWFGGLILFIYFAVAVIWAKEKLS